jgi:hypothetical protein
MAVVALLSLHAGLLGWIGLRNSPGLDEVAHLSAGLSHWKLGRFELYRVNPPLVRMIAAVPLLFLDVNTDWSDYTDAPYTRPEFSVGNRFFELNGAKTFLYFTFARWMCIPLSLIGGLVVFAWARALFGRASGLLALSLWCLSPNILGNSAMITPDAPAASLGVVAVYFFWRWLKQPAWQRAIWAGLTLGIAELTKTTWIILFGLMPAFWLVWRVTECRRPLVTNTETSPQPKPATASIWQLLSIFLLAIYVVNCAYAFEDSFRPLSTFSFVSQALSGHRGHEPSNRFKDSWVGHVPIPVPVNYLKGIDTQRYDFETGKDSYLGGVQKFGGWWYWYLYALAVKVPLGTWCLGVAAIIASWQFRYVRASWRDQLVLLAPAAAVLILVSSQTGFTRYVRYVLPIAPFCFIWIGQVAQWVGHWRIRSGIVVGAAVFSVVSSLMTYPHSLSYFNELAGGPLNGADRLLDANIDWGQDLLYLKRWCDAHSENRPLYLQYFGLPTSAPQIAGIDSRPMPKIRGFDSPDFDSPDVVTFEPALEPGWYAISVNDLYAYKHFGSEMPWFSYLLPKTPVARAGYSIRIYQLSPRDVKAAERPHS